MSKKRYCVCCGLPTVTYKIRGKNYCLDCIEEYDIDIKEPEEAR